MLETKAEFRKKYMLIVIHESYCNDTLVSLNATMKYPGRKYAVRYVNCHSK